MMFNSHLLRNLLIICVFLIRMKNCSTNSPSSIKRQLDFSSFNYVTSNIDTHHRSRRDAKWPTTDITWGFNQTGFEFVRTQNVNVENVEEIFRSAFNVWETFTCLRFYKVTAAKANIQIKFARGDHGDEYPFDGNGHNEMGRGFTNLVGHAFYPGYGRGGDIHLDADEKWDFEIYNKYYRIKDGMKNLKSVAVHEIGHSLGLRDTNIIDSVMFAAYSHPCRLEQLYEYDQRNIRNLYGCEMKPTSPPKCADDNEITDDEMPESNAFNVCNITYDSITKFRGELFIFKNQYFWRVKKYGYLVDHGAPKISGMFNDLPPNFTKVDAVYERNAGSKSSGITIFIGNKCYLYNAHNQLTRVSTLRQMGFPEQVEKIDAVLRIKFDSVKEIYIFSGAQFWEFDESQWRMKSMRPREISEKWHGIGNRIDGAFQHDKKIYFFRGNRFFEFNFLKKKVVQNKPKSSLSEYIKECPRVIQVESNEMYIRRKLEEAKHAVLEFDENGMSNDI